MMTHKQFKVFSTATFVGFALAISACGDTSKREMTNEQLMGQEAMAAAKTGSKPGVIQVSGVAVSKVVVKKSIDQKEIESQELALDKRISVNSVEGKGLDGKALKMTENEKNALKKLSEKVTLKNEKEFETLAGKRLYVNLGCTLDDKQIEYTAKTTEKDGTETTKVEKMKEILGDSDAKLQTSAASRVFICGAQKIKDEKLKNMNITADELYLNDASISMDGDKASRNHGGIRIRANKLFLQGKNTISTKAKDGDGVSGIYRAMDIRLDVKTSIEGDGSLELISQGGSAIAKPKTEQKKQADVQTKAEDKKEETNETKRDADGLDKNNNADD